MRIPSGMVFLVFNFPYYNHAHLFDFRETSLPITKGVDNDVIVKYRKKLTKRGNYITSTA